MLGLRPASKNMGSEQVAFLGTMHSYTHTHTFQLTALITLKCCPILPTVQAINTSLSNGMEAMLTNGGSQRAGPGVGPLDVLDSVIRQPLRMALTQPAAPGQIIRGVISSTLAVGCMAQAKGRHYRDVYPA